MRHENHCSFVFVKCLGNYWKVAEVDVIRWFVQDEKSRLFKSEFAEHHESFLSFRKCTDLCVHDFTSNEKSCRKRTKIFFEHLTTCRLKKTIINFLIKIKCREILSVVSDFYAVGDFYSFCGTIGDGFE